MKKTRLSNEKASSLKLVKRPSTVSTISYVKLVLSASVLALLLLQLSLFFQQPIRILLLQENSQRNESVINRFREVAADRRWGTMKLMSRRGESDLIELYQNSLTAACSSKHEQGLRRGMQKAEKICSKAIVKKDPIFGEWSVNRTELPSDMSCLDQCLQLNDGDVNLTSNRTQIAFHTKHPNALTQLYIGEDITVAYIPVPKTGSSVLRHFLFQDRAPDFVSACESQSELGNFFSWQNSTIVSPYPDISFVMVRDPLERFASGILEICDYSSQGRLREWGLEMATSVLDVSPQCNNFEDDQNCKAWLEDAVLSLACGNWDEHITPQTVFLDSLPDDRVSFTVPFADLSLIQDIISPLRESSFKDSQDCVYLDSPDGVHVDTWRAVELEARCRRRRADYVLRRREHDHDMIIKLMETALSDHARNVWCLSFALDYMRLNQLYCPPIWCDYGKDFPACGRNSFIFELAENSSDQFAVWAVPQSVSSSFEEMLAHNPQEMLNFWHAVVSHIKKLWNLEHGYHLRLLPMSTRKTHMDYYHSFLVDRKVPAMTESLLRLAERVGFVVCVLSDRKLLIQPPPLPIHQNPAYALGTPINFTDKSGRIFSSNMTPNDILVKETPHTRVFLDAQARPVLVATMRRLRDSGLHYLRDMGELTDDELLDLWRSSLAAVGSLEWIDIRINAGVHQNLPHFHLKIWLPEDTFSSVWSAFPPFVALRSALMSKYASVYSEDGTDRSSSHTCSRHIIQVGAKRTATTLQFQILCALAVLMYRHCNVECGYNQWINPRGGVLVTKTHNMEEALAVVNASSSRSTFLFATSAGDNSKNMPNETLMNDIYERAVFVCDINRASVSSAEEIIQDYLPYFEGITNEDVEAVVDYIRKWIPLRRCCGKQMSKHTRAWLISLEEKHGDPNTPFFLNSTQEGLPCEGFDLSTLEAQFMKTDLFLLYTVQKPWLQKLAQPAIRDGAMTGNYCEEYSRAVKFFHIGFNQEPTSIQKNEN